MQFYTTASGLKYEIRKANKEGAQPHEGQTVSVHYMVTLEFDKLEDGPWLDSSYDRGEEIKFKIGRGDVIEGVDTAIREMKLLELRWLEIPPELAFGNRGVPPIIPPQATLYVAIYLMGIQD